MFEGQIRLRHKQSARGSLCRSARELACYGLEQVRGPSPPPRPVGARVFRAVVRQSRVAPAESSKWPRLAFRYKQTQSPARQIQRSVLGPKGAAAANLNRRRCRQENASAGPARRKGIETKWKERRGPSRYREAASLGLPPDTLSRVPAVGLAWTMPRRTQPWES